MHLCVAKLVAHVLCSLTGGWATPAFLLTSTGVLSLAVALFPFPKGKARVREARLGHQFKSSSAIERMGCKLKVRSVQQNLGSILQVVLQLSYELASNAVAAIPRQNTHAFQFVDAIFATLLVFVH